MNPRPSTNAGRFARFAATTVAMLFSLSVFGQQTPPADETPPADDNVVVLSPFVVSTERDQGYFAENTLAGSRMKTNVADLAASITVVTLQQFEDTASVDINDIFRYEANTEGSGSYTPAVQSLRNDGVVDVNAGYTHGGSGQPQTNATANRVRGIGIPSSAQNFYPAISQVPFDSYNIQSIEISRGPNSMLFGMGSPAGIVNQTTAQAVIGRDSTSVSFRFDSNESRRGSLTFNRNLIDDKLAIMGAFLYDDRRFERKPSYDKTKRMYGALTFQPFSKTVIRASIEDYDNRNRRPNTLTPRDSVSEWRNAGSPAYDPITGLIHITATGQVKGPLALRNGSPRIAETRAYIASLPGYDASLWNAAQTTYNGVGIVGGGAITNANSVLYTPGLSFSSTNRPIMQISDGVVQNHFFPDAFRYRPSYNIPNPNGTPAIAQYPTEAAVFADPGWAAVYDQAYTVSNFWSATGNGIGSYRYPGVTDRSIYDWENINTLQMNFGNDENTTYNVELEQRLLDNLFLNLGWFRQDFESVTNYTVSQLNVSTLFVDTNLRLPDGRQNPYFGLPYLLDFDPDQFVNTELNDNYRGMLAWTPDFTQREGWTKWFGRHQVLALASRNDVTRSFIRKRWFHTASEEEANGTIFFFPNQNDDGNGNPTGWRYLQGRSIQRWYYLANPGDPATGAVTRASGENESANMHVGQMQYYNYDQRGWDTLGMTGEYIDHNATTGRTERVVDSVSFGITSYLWSDRVVATFGVRKDKYKARSTTTGAILDEAGNQVEPGLSNPEQYENGYFLTDKIFNRFNRYDKLEGTTRTTGLVFRPFQGWAGIERSAADGSRWHQFISSLGFSYNKSDNFNPPPSAQVDGFGTPLPKPTGEGEDYGFQFSLFENKLFARVNWFKATNESERTNPGTSISRLTLNVDTTLFRNWARTIALINMGHDPLDPTTFGVGLDPSQEDALETATAAIWQLPYDYYQDIGSIGATRSAEAEGMEVQVTYNPSRNWTMKFTGGKQETRYSNVLKEFDAWFAERDPVWTAARAADYLLPQYQNLATYTTNNGIEVNITDFWNAYGYNGNVRLGDQFGNENSQLYFDSVVTPQAAIARDLEGQLAPGQRKYRWSFLTNYTFTEGRLQGFSAGGNLRWEDKAVIGYFGRVNPGSGSTDLTLSDVTKPIYDEANTYTDLWVSYSRKVWDNRVNMKIQLNVVNVFESGGLRVVGVNYDGSPNSYRIIDPRQFILTTKFEF